MCSCTHHLIPAAPLPSMLLHPINHLLLLPAPGIHAAYLCMCIHNRPSACPFTVSQWHLFYLTGHKSYPALTRSKHLSTGVAPPYTYHSSLSLVRPCHPYSPYPERTCTIHLPRLLHASWLSCNWPTLPHPWPMPCTHLTVWFQLSPQPKHVI